MPAEDHERADREGAAEGDRGLTDEERRGGIDDGNPGLTGHPGTHREGASARERRRRERTDGVNRLVEDAGREEASRGEGGREGASHGATRGGVVDRPPAGTEDPLADRYRRNAVDHLREADGPVRVAELARHVVARTADKPPDVVSLDEQKRMYTALQRTHLPLLEGSGVVALDPVAETVELADE